MNIPNQKQKSVQLHDFSMNPSSEVPRSQFNLSHGRKVPFQFSHLVPILCRFALPGDTWNCNISTAARTAVPLVPVQDNWRLNYFSFFVPMRLVWDNSKKFFGEQATPGDSIAYIIPRLTPSAGGFPGNSIYDYMGLPPQGQADAGITGINALPFRAMNLIWNEWFRDENLQDPVPVPKTDGPDALTNYSIMKRGKRFDYITQALPWPQKGNTAITVPLGTRADIRGLGRLASGAPGSPGQSTKFTGGITETPTWQVGGVDIAATWGMTVTTDDASWFPDIYADLTTATGSTINALRTSIVLQQYLEKDARGGTRYNEFVWNMYKVRTADARLQRPEFIGGGHAPINTVPIAQTSATGQTGATTPIGTLAATGYVGQGRAGFTYSATEHGYIICYVCATADLTYSQGLERMWTMSTRYDVPVPLLANLGEQALLNKEIFADGSAADEEAFGYVPRFDEYRFIPSTVVGLYRPTTTGNIAYWHSSQLFETLPTLGNDFIEDNAGSVLTRNFAAGVSADYQQILADFYFDIKAARPLPLYGIPGLTRL